MAAFAQLQETSDQAQIRKLLSDQVKAWNQGNIDRFMKGYWESDSLLFVGHNGITRGYANTLKDYKNFYPDTVKMGKLFFELQRIEPLAGDYCFVCGKWLLKRTIGDTGGYFTLLFHRINGEWKIIADHTS
jgi:ketosteroid isomerase-like protein